ncbi:MAG: TlpA family protein disulfide reductase [Nitrospinae bacterium]|nr:TlpA family protein disulfide reductase [Nitrospinota bacterium]
MKRVFWITVVAAGMFSLLSANVLFAELLAVVGKPAPNVVGSTIDTEEPFSMSRAPDKVKVVNFFNRTCVPCVQEMPEFAEMEKRHPKVLFYAVHVPWKKDGNVDAAGVKKFVGSLKAHVRTVLVGGVKLRELYGFKQLPLTVVLDGDNVVRAVVDGMNIPMVEKAVAALEGK